MSGPLILVVDDQPAAQRLLVRILEKQGYEARAVGDVASAIDLLDREEFALVMTDLDMPGASGFDLIEAVSPRTPDIATILVTGRGSTQVASTALTEALVCGHEDLVQEAARDLVENALVHTEGKVWVSTSRNRDEAALVVADEGPGIPDDLLNKLLHEPFVQGIPPARAG